MLFAVPVPSLQFQRPNWFGLLGIQHGSSPSSRQRTESILSSKSECFFVIQVVIRRYWQEVDSRISFVWKDTAMSIIVKAIRMQNLGIILSVSTQVRMITISNSLTLLCQSSENSTFAPSHYKAKLINVINSLKM